MKKLLIIMLPLALICQPTLPSQPPKFISTFKEEETAFYFVGGGPYAGRNLLADEPWKPLAGTEVLLGQRKFSGNHAIDYIVGGVFYRAPLFFLPYIQCSYLHFPSSQNGIYFGIGLTGTINPYTVFMHPQLPWWAHILPFNVPLTLGYQMKDSKQFVQLQAGPLTTYNVSISYGFGF